MVNTECQEDH